MAAMAEERVAAVAAVREERVAAAMAAERVAAMVAEERVAERVVAMAKVKAMAAVRAAVGRARAERVWGAGEMVAAGDRAEGLAATVAVAEDAAVDSPVAPLVVAALVVVSIHRLVRPWLVQGPGG